MPFLTIFTPLPCHFSHFLRPKMLFFQLFEGYFLNIQAKKAPLDAIMTPLVYFFKHYLCAKRKVYNKVFFLSFLIKVRFLLNAFKNDEWQEMHIFKAFIPDFLSFFNHAKMKIIKDPFRTKFLIETPSSEPHSKEPDDRRKSQKNI